MIFAVFLFSLPPIVRPLFVSTLFFRCHDIVIPYLNININNIHIINNIIIITNINYTINNINIVILNILIPVVSSNSSTARGVAWRGSGLFIPPTAGFIYKGDFLPPPAGACLLTIFDVVARSRALLWISQGGSE